MDIRWLLYYMVKEYLQDIGIHIRGSPYTWTPTCPHLVAIQFPRTNGQWRRCEASSQPKRPIHEPAPSDLKRSGWMCVCDKGTKTRPTALKLFHVRWNLRPLLFLFFFASFPSLLGLPIVVRRSTFLPAGSIGYIVHTRQAVIDNFVALLS